MNVTVSPLCDKTWFMGLTKTSADSGTRALGAVSSLRQTSLVVGTVDIL